MATDDKTDDEWDAVVNYRAPTNSADILKVLGEKLSAIEKSAEDETKDLTQAKLDDLLADSPKFEDYAKKPAPVREKSSNKSRQWQTGFPSTYGQAGTVTTLTVQPRCPFRGEKIIATDSAKPAGSGTLIAGLFVGQKSQFPYSNPVIPTSGFSANSLGRGMKMDTCHAALQIAMTVSFIVACTFDACIFGRAIV